MKKIIAVAMFVPLMTTVASEIKTVVDLSKTIYKVTQLSLENVKGGPVDNDSEAYIRLYRLPYEMGDVGMGIDEVQNFNQFYSKVKNQGQIERIYEELQDAITFIKQYKKDERLRPEDRTPIADDDSAELSPDELKNRLKTWEQNYEASTQSRRAAEQYAEAWRAEALRLQKAVEQSTHGDPTQLALENARLKEELAEAKRDGASVSNFLGLEKAKFKQVTDEKNTQQKEIEKLREELQQQKETSQKEYESAGLKALEAIIGMDREIQRLTQQINELTTENNQLKMQLGEQNSSKE